jgi:quinoprotein glucose dehydrogenase
VAQPTKSGDLFLFDRMDGASLYPMIDVPAPSSSIPGERAASHQLESTVTFTRRRFHPTTRSAEAKRFVENLLQPLDQRRWAPPSLQGTLLYPAYDGGAEWGGAAFNPASNQLVVNAQEVGGIVRLYEFARGESAAATYALQCGGCHGMDLGGTDAGPALKGVADRLSISEIFAVVASGRGRMPGFSTLPREQLSAVIGHLFNPAEVDETVSGETQYGFAGYTVIRDPDGLPGNQPPWGTLSAIDLASGDTVWRVALGDYPGYEGRGWGAENYGGPVVTAAGLIFIAATPDARLRAFDASTGAELWSGKLPHAGFATPSVYAVDGRQYVVIAAGGGKLGQASGSQYVAFALPR